MPTWFCLTTALFDRLRAPLAAELTELTARTRQADGAAVARVSEQIRELFRRAPLPDGVEEALLDTFDATFGPPARVAVRSSALDEDSSQASFAGNLHTYLNVPRARLLDSVRDCFASVYSAPASAYRRIRGLGTEPATAVIVQQMVDAHVSGVLFTANPTTGRRDEMVIAAAYGLGEGVVADLVPTDSFTIERGPGVVRERRINRKTERIVFDHASGHGTTRSRVPDDLAAAAVLADAELAALCKIGEQIEALGARPQDIEWVLDEHRTLFVTQARPITTLEEGPERVFDNSNIVEGYPGVTTPLTYSYARRAYERTFYRAMRTLGAPPKLLEDNATLFGNMVGFIDGRLYYDLTTWYRCFALVPGLEKQLDAWEKAIGFSHGRGGLTFRARFSRWERLRANSKLLSCFVLLERRIGAFHEEVTAALAAVDAEPLERLDAEECVRVFERFVSRIEPIWDVTLVNDFFAVLFFDSLKRLVTAWGLDDSDGLVNDLLCGEAAMQSVAPVRSLLDLASQVRARPDLAAAFRAQPDAGRLLEEIPRQDAGAEFLLALDRHMKRYGDRIARELMLETPRGHEDPARIVAQIRAYLDGAPNADDLERQTLAVRRAAEQKVAERLAGQPVRAALFRFVLDRTRAVVRNRENTRMERTRAFGRVRRIFMRIGGVFAEKSILGRADDVFYLTVEEVIDFVRGASVSRSLKELVALRRAEHQANQAHEPGRRIRTHGIVYANSFDGEAERAASPTADAEQPRDDLLVGQGCSAGKVRGAAKIVIDPLNAGDTRGRILVAPMTDPGWVFLMVNAAGLVVERGSPLSHTAIIGRELGIPTVVAVPGATSKISDGQEIELDGQRGTVQLF